MDHKQSKEKLHAPCTVQDDIAQRLPVTHRLNWCTTCSPLGMRSLLTPFSPLEQIHFRNERHSDGPTYSDDDGTLGRSPTSTAKVRSDVPHNSSHISKRTSEEKPEISLISQSLVFPPEGSKVKNYEAETTSNNLGTNDSPVSLGYVTNIKLSEIPALRECRSLSVPEEQT